MIYPQYGYPSPTYYPQMQQNMYTAQQQQQPVQQQIRSGGIVSVASEEEARRYPVAPGFTVTMRDETGPYLYEKTMGYSQLDQPIFRKAKIVFEDDAQVEENKTVQPAEPPKIYAELKQLEALRDAVAIEFKKMRDLFETIRAREEYHD